MKIFEAKAWMMTLALAATVSACGSQMTEEGSETKTICGASRDFVAVNSYTGPEDWVQVREEAVGRLNYGCTGTYIGTVNGTERLFITAGHCLARVGTATRIEFNFEQAADGPVFSVRGKTLERSDSPDYALVQLDSEPGLEPTPLSLDIGSKVIVIQHPQSARKVVASGTVRKTTSSSRIFYSDVDTLGGSSGAGILNSVGELVGIHTLGGCSKNGGANSGWNLNAIGAASDIL